MMTPPGGGQRAAPVDLLACSSWVPGALMVSVCRLGRDVVLRNLSSTCRKLSSLVMSLGPDPPAVGLISPCEGHRVTSGLSLGQSTLAHRGDHHTGKL